MLCYVSKNFFRNPMFSLSPGFLTILHLPYGVGRKNFENPPYIKSCVLKCRLEIWTLFLILPKQKFEKSSNDCQSCRKHEFLHVIELLIKILQKVDGKQTGSQENSGFLRKKTYRPFLRDPNGIDSRGIQFLLTSGYCGTL